MRVGENQGLDSWSWMTEAAYAPKREDDNECVI